MSKLVLAVISLLAFGLTSRTVFAKEYYSNNFEKKSGIKFSLAMGGGGIPWTGSAAAKEKSYIIVNDEGLSREKAISGKSSYKLDLTLNKGYWCYYRQKFQPKRHLESPTYFSGYLYIEKDSGCKIGLAVEWTNPEGSKGCTYSVPRIKRRADGWSFYQSEDIYQELKKIWESKKRKVSWDPSKVYIDKWYVDITGSFKGFGGKKVIIYVDNVKLGNEKVEELPLSSVRKDDTFLGERERYEVRKKRRHIPRQMIGKNLIKNSGFELGMDGWEVTVWREEEADHKLDETVSFEGKTSLCIEHKKYIKPLPKKGTFLRSQQLPVSKNKDYNFSLYLKKEGDVEVAVAQKGWPSISVFKNISPSSEWQRYVVPVKFTSHLAPYLILTIKGKGKVWIDAIQLEEGEKATSYLPPPLLLFSLSTDNDGNIYSLGEEPEINFHLWNGKEKKVKGEMVYQIKDFYHNIVGKGNFHFNLNPKQPQKITKKINIGKKGIFYLRAVLSEKGGSISTYRDAEINLAVISPRENKKLSKDYFFGNSQWNYNDPEKGFRIAKKIGMKFFSPYGPFDYCDTPRDWKEKIKKKNLWPKKESVSSSGGAELCLELAEKYNIPLLGSVGGLPSWAVGKETNSWYWQILPKPEKITEEVISDWSDYIYAVVDRFKDKIKHWNIWGESVKNKESAQIMVKFAKAFYQSAKKADPSCVVLGLSFMPAKKNKMLRRAELFFKAGGLDYLDKISIHPYSFGVSTESVEYGRQLEDLKKLMRKYGEEKGIWSTESGWKALNTYCEDIVQSEKELYSQIISEETQSDYVIRQNIISKAHGVEKHATFLVYGGTIARPGSYGFTYNSCSSPKAVLPAYAAMVALLENTSFVGFS